MRLDSYIESNSSNNTYLNDVQSFWNSIKLKLVELANLVAPMEEFIDNKTAESDTQSPIIKRKINLRKRLLLPDVDDVQTLEEFYIGVANINL